jgi:pyruvate formate lyase activating enzyme
VRNLCRNCLKCFEVCPAGAVIIDTQGKVQIDRKNCIKCGRCVQVCPYNARKLYGREVTVDEVMQEIMRSAPFYTRSGGGLTVSGGEPTVQWEFLNCILIKAKQKYVHTAIETCGYVTDRKILECILPNVDLFLFDIKCIDESKHKHYTGVSNEIILENARYISSENKSLIIRIPVIPGFNDCRDEIEDIVRFCLKLGSVLEINLLPYHELGRSKYGMLDREYLHQPSVCAISDEIIYEFKAYIESRGMQCQID